MLSCCPDDDRSLCVNDIFSLTEWDPLKLFNFFLLLILKIQLTTANQYLKTQYKHFLPQLHTIPAYSEPIPSYKTIPAYSDTLPPSYL